MKLILGYNQRPQFRNFYTGLAAASNNSMEYADYAGLLFVLDGAAAEPIRVQHTRTGKWLDAYDGVYLNNYMPCYEQAAAAALVCQELKVPFVNRELGSVPSLSKLTAYVKLAAARVPIPRTLAGGPAALLAAESQLLDDLFPAVLKRADADRGIDNFKVKNRQQVAELLAEQNDKSIWILQAFLPNDGFYVVSYYNTQPAFAIFRTLESRPDANELKAHMYKPKGGANAHLIEPADIPRPLLETSDRAMRALNRQIGSVDCLYDSGAKTVHVLEVNYNPQLVTIETFKERRQQAFLKNLQVEW